MVNSPEKIKTVPVHLTPAAADIKVQLGWNSDNSAKMDAISSLPQILTQVIKMTELTLNAEAASILLFRNNDQELYFEAASGPVGRTLHQVKLNTQYGIAGQVARTGKPLIVNDVARSKNFHKMMDDTTGFATESLICAPLSVNKKILGVIEVLNKHDGTPFGEHDLEAAVSVANTAAIAIENTRLHQILAEGFRITLETAASAVDARSTFTRGHSQRVMEYAVKAGSILSLATEDIEALEYAGLLHDIGKVSIDNHILNKNGALTPKEWEVIRQHPVAGAEMVSSVPFLEKAALFIRHHHERYDGKGYPDGIKGDEIPMGARIIAVANAYDVMTNNRPGSAAVSIEEAVKELHANTGSQFCPVAVKALISGLRLHSSQE